MSSGKKGELKRVQLKESENDSKKAKLLTTKTRTERISINQLDHDCLAIIFSYLPVLDRLEIKKVCKKWEQAVDLSWHNVKKLDPENLPILIQERKLIFFNLLDNCCRFLTHLTIDFRYIWIAGIVKKNCQNIVYFDVKSSSGYWSPIRNCIQSMSKLKCLKIEITSPQAFDMLLQILEHLPVDIEEIHLVASDFDEIPPYAPPLDKFTNLRCFTLESFRLTTSTIESILLNKNSLVYLDLNRCHFPWEYPKIFSKLIHLEHLNLDSVKDLDVDIVAEIAHTCQKLKYFVYSEKELLPVDDEPGLIERTNLLELKYLVNIEHLDVSANEEWEGDVDFMPDVVNNCKKLKHLNVGGGQNFSIVDIEAITKLKNLEFLDLSSVKLDFELFGNIASNCLELREIIMKFENLPEIALEKLTNLKKLEKLNLDLCLNVTDNLLSEIANNCKNLVDLSLAGCKNVTDASLLRVGQLQHLTRLNISEIENVPNVMFDNIYQLESLICYECPSVIDVGIFNVIDNCPKLSFLDVWRTGITVDTLVHAAKRIIAYKKLRIYVDNNVYDDYFKLTDKHSRYLDIIKK